MYLDNFERNDRFRVRRGGGEESCWKRSIEACVNIFASEFPRWRFPKHRISPRRVSRATWPAPSPPLPPPRPTNARNVKIIFPALCARVLFLPAHAYVISAVNDHRSIPCRGILRAPDGRAARASSWPPKSDVE